MKIAEVEQILKEISIEALEFKIQEFMDDERQGVVKICDKYRRKLEKYHKELSEWEFKLEFDRVFHQNEYIYVGVDEVGRGPLAGPVVACAVILPYECDIRGLKDSKKLSEEKREELYDIIYEKALYVGVGMVGPEEIDRINILQATFKAMREALGSIKAAYQIVGVDGDKIIPQVEVTQHAIIKGDDKSAAIAAASVIAKVTRDRMMKEYAVAYPVYDWESNKGYGSNKHYDGIRAYGITELHRKSFLKNEGY
ncbi:MAG: ribonuclease HII [Cellulosilyticaceae bacterium]